MLFHPAKVPLTVFSILFKSHSACCDNKSICLFIINTTKMIHINVQFLSGNHVSLTFRFAMHRISRSNLTFTCLSINANHLNFQKISTWLIHIINNYRYIAYSNAYVNSINFLLVLITWISKGNVMNNYCFKCMNSILLLAH